MGVLFRRDLAVTWFSFPLAPSFFPLPLFPQATARPEFQPPSFTAAPVTHDGQILAIRREQDGETRYVLLDREQLFAGRPIPNLITLSIAVTTVWPSENATPRHAHSISLQRMELPSDATSQMRAIVSALPVANSLSSGERANNSATPNVL